MKIKEMIVLLAVSFLVILVLAAASVTVKTKFFSVEKSNQTKEKKEDSAKLTDIPGPDDVPAWVEWKEKELVKEKDVKIKLNDMKVKVYCNDEMIWESPDEIYVQDIMLCEIDGVKECPEQKRRTDDVLTDRAPAGETELLLVCWKIGRYGEKRPFWVGEDEECLSQHLFVYNVWQNEVKPRWMSSYIGQDICSIECENEKIIIEDVKGNRTKWVWNNFGFQLFETIDNK
ncbi:MAG: hypothetical protein IKN54_06250 [Lachnospiraceae bacterium]|nr:hypothetical protein [Lachnospiraceae bacterium]